MEFAAIGQWTTQRHESAILSGMETGSGRRKGQDAIFDAVSLIKSSKAVGFFPILEKASEKIVGKNHEHQELCPQLPSTALANKHLRVHLLTFLCGVGDERCSYNSAAKISRQ